jgi:hypothetical protein
MAVNNVSIAGTAAIGDAPLRSAEWHPRLAALYRYWRSLHEGAGLPARRDLDPSAIREQLPTMWMLDVVREPLRFRYRLIGTRIREANDRDLTGLWLDEAHPTVAAQADGFARFRQVAIEGRPSWRRGAPTLFLARRDFRSIENLFLPMASDGHTVDLILANTVFYRHDGSET